MRFHNASLAPSAAKPENLVFNKLGVCTHNNNNTTHHEPTRSLTKCAASTAPRTCLVYLIFDRMRPVRVVASIPNNAPYNSRDPVRVLRARVRRGFLLMSFKQSHTCLTHCLLNHRPREPIFFPATTSPTASQIFTLHRPRNDSPEMHLQCQSDIRVNETPNNEPEEARAKDSSTRRQNSTDSRPNETQVSRRSISQARDRCGASTDGEST